MKKQICFVGFVNDELSGIKKAISAMSEHWDVSFVADGAAALEFSRRLALDAVVTRMRLPDMNGAELLQKAGEVNNATLRFVVGEVTDRELILNCIGGTHQFISRPFAPQDLISVIQRSFGLDAWLASDQLRAVAKRLHRLPSLPSTYFEVLKQVESPNSNIESVGTVIARDPVATARLLQLVNSASFALAQKVTDPVDAVCLLGVETVKSLALCLQVFTQGDEAKQSGVSFEQLWSHSFEVAKTARDLTLRRTRDAGLANDAFSAGLLHDVGRIVLATNLPQEYAAVVATAKSEGRLLHEVEIEQLGVNHAQIGAYLLGLWGMPASVVEAAALHHAPRESAAQEFSLLTAVHVANVFAHEHEPNKDLLPLPQLDRCYLDALGLINTVDSWRKTPAANKSPAGDTERIVQPPPVISRSGAPPATTAKISSDWILKFLVPATAAVLLLIIFFVWKNSGVAPQPMTVQAKTVQDSISMAAKTADENAPKTEVTAAVATPEQARLVAVATSAAPAKVTAPTPVADATAAKPADPAIQKFNSVKVQGIIFGPGGASAIINGKPVFVGEFINGLEVVSIQETNVVLSFEGTKRSFAVR